MVLYLEVFASFIFCRFFDFPAPWGNKTTAHLLTFLKKLYIDFENEL